MNSRIIGRIIEVNGLLTKAVLFELLPPYLITNGKRETAPKINGFVKTRVGLDTVICQVVGEYNQEENNELKAHYLRLEVKGYLSEDGFIQGLRVLPIVSANIELLDSSDYSKIFSSPRETTINIGNDLYDDSKTIDVEINKLIVSHIGVFGNTGSGKSNTLTKIMSSYYSIIEKHNTKAGKFLVVDLNNEYGGDAICNEENKTIYRLSTRRGGSKKKVPLNVDNLDEDDFVVLMNASQKTQAPVVKSAYREMSKTKEESRGDDYYLNYIKSMLKNSRKQLFTSIRHYLSEYISGIENFYFHSGQSKFYYKKTDGSAIYLDNSEFDFYLNKITINFPKDKLDRFLFELYFAVAHENENGVTLDFMMPLLSRARKIVEDFKKIFDFSEDFTQIFREKNVCVVQLAGVNRDMKEIVPSIIANNIFNTLSIRKEEKDKVEQVINIVVDEAHNILYEDKKDVMSHESVLQVFERVVKEGRKFGLFLMLASQRPSDISPTIISQLHNYFIHKLVNPSDIAMIRKAVAYMDERSLDFITILAPGECIVSGTAFQMPAFIYVHQVEEKQRPKSEDVTLTGKNGLFAKKDTPNQF